MGRLEIEGPGHSAASSLVRGPKRVALLVYLASTHPGSFVRRDTLLPLLWPDLDQSRARHALRNTLHELRKALGGNTIISRGKEEIALADSVLWYDVVAFEQALSEGSHEEAVALYRGDFLEGFFVPDVAAEFEHWMDGERDRLSHLHATALEQIAESREGRGEYRRASEVWRQLVRREPIRERFVVRLMESLVAAGDRGGGLREAEAYARLMRREFDADPAPRVVSLVTELRSGGNEFVAGERVTTALSLREPRNSPSIRPTPAAELPLVGRDSEWRQLQTAWHAAAQGRTGFVVITGVAGIGKTRLAEQQLMWAAGEDFVHAHSHCYAAEGRLAYGPIAEWLRTDSLRAGLLDLEPIWLTEVARVVPELLAERPDLPRPEPLTESWQRRQFLEALARGVLTAPQPLVLLIDDLQWCDKETLEWLRFLGRFAPDAALLVVGTVRDDDPDLAHPWRRLKLALLESGQLTEIALKPLDQVDTAALAACVADRELTTSQTDRVFVETEGNPLFVVESVRAGLLEIAAPAEASAGNRSAWLPPRVQAVIEFRLSQLSTPAREVVELSATIGHPFTIEVLAEAGMNDEDDLARALDELSQRRIFEGRESEAYDFSHEKLREVAYAAIGPARRLLLHRRVARALEAVFSSNLDALSSRLAAHYELAGRPEDAILYYERAAEVARGTYADEEVVSLLKRALTLLAAIPTGKARDKRELKLQIALGVTAVAARGWAAAEAGAAFARASELCQQGGGLSSELLTAAWGVHAFHAVRGDLDRAVEVTVPFDQIAHSESHPEALMVRHLLLGFNEFHFGRLLKANHLLGLAAESVNLRGPRIPFVAFPVGVLTFCYRAHAQWHLGNGDEALACIREALSLAEKPVDDPFALAIALAYEAMLHQFRDEPVAARTAADATLTLCEKYGVNYYRAWATILRGWALGAEGEPERGIEEIERGLSDLLRTGAELRRPYYLGLLASLHGRNGDARTGLAILSEAVAAARENDEGWCLPELHRLEGEMHALRGARPEAASNFRLAIDLTREHGAEAVAAKAAAGLEGL